MDDGGGGMLSWWRSGQRLGFRARVSGQRKTPGKLVALQAFAGRVYAAGAAASGVMVLDGGWPGQQEEKRYSGCS